MLKPDLIYWDPSGNIVTALDAAIVSDNVDPGIPYKAKTTKYDKQAVTEYAREISGKDSVLYGALVINWRGAIAKESKELLKGLLTKRDLVILSVRVLQYGLYCYDFWNKSKVMLQPATAEGESFDE